MSYKMGYLWEYDPGYLLGDFVAGVVSIIELAK